MDKVGIQNSKFKIVVDGINSIGGVAIPKLLDSLNVEVVKINCNPNGNFAHDPEPLAENLRELCDAVLENNADLGIDVDPDVDLLVIVDEKGDRISSFGKGTLGEKPDQFIGPHGMAVDSAGSVYVAEVSYTAFGSNQDPPREVASLRKWERIS